MIELSEELSTLGHDLASLAAAYRENADNKAAVLRMVAAKAHHAGQTFTDLADALDRGDYAVDYGG
jgi:hypothetical protein